MRQSIIRPSWLIAGFLVASGAHAGEPTSAAAADDTLAASQIVTIDQATGKMRAPTASERQALRENAKALKSARQAEPRFAGKKGFVAPATEAAAASSKRVLANGGTAMQVPESYMSHLTAVRDANGQLHIQHQGDDGSHADTPAVNGMEATHE